jgi:hypothetical protein
MMLLLLHKQKFGANRSIGFDHFFVLARSGREIVSVFLISQMGIPDPSFKKKKNYRLYIESRRERDNGV